MQTIVSMFRGTMVSKRYVSYLRVSTPKQGENGLGVEGQREAVRRYLLSHHGEQIAEFVEVESGKRSDRPQLQAAMALYRVPEIVTLGRLPGEGESDSRWRTREVRHVGSDTLTPGF